MGMKKRPKLKKCAEMLRDIMDSEDEEEEEEGDEGDVAADDDDL